LAKILEASGPRATKLQYSRWVTDGGKLPPRGAAEDPSLPEPPRIPATIAGEDVVLTDGAVVIAAITSCTNTSNPSVMVAAGLVAKKAVERGLRRRPWVKTSLAPGSKVVTEYLNDAG